MSKSPVGEFILENVLFAIAIYTDVMQPHVLCVTAFVFARAASVYCLAFAINVI